MSFDALCAFLTEYRYEACPRFGTWRMWAGPHALENTVPELLGSAEQLLTDHEYLALIRAIKNRLVPVHAPGDVDHAGDGGQPRAE